jgi:uncharacterized protein YtpQ (UPF0354 family)
MPITLYLDTNIYLSFYHLSSDDLDELDKIVALVEHKEVELLVPWQTINEYRRNRDVKLKDALIRFNENKLNTAFPLFCKDYEVEFNALQEAVKVYEFNKKKIIQRVNEDIANYELKADRIIEELFKNSTKIEATNELLEFAKRRFDLGNPPGKNNSYGDALIWECLVSTVKPDTDLYLISDDKDFYSIIDNQKLNSFLKKEWDHRKKTKIYYYKKLSSFMMDKFPGSKFASEIRKEMFIQKLKNSPSFKDTRIALRGLSQYSDYTSEQLEVIILAAISNNQIYWIAKNDYVNTTLYKIIEGKTHQINSPLFDVFERTFNLSIINETAVVDEPINDDDLPF